jgi:ABC-type polysaccharide/polyol phosphate export permease
MLLIPLFAIYHVHVIGVMLLIPLFAIYHVHVIGVMLLIPLFAVYHVHVTWLALWAIPILLVEFCLMLGIAFVFSSINLFYRDVRHVVPLLTQVWMYLTPIIYGTSSISPKILPFYMALNPVAPITDSFRKVILVGQPPMYIYLGISAAISFALMCFGYWLLKRLEPAFAELI